MGVFSDSDLARRGSLAALLFRLEQRHAPEELGALIDEVIAWFRRHSEYEALKNLFTDLVRQAMAGIGTSVAIPDDLVEMKTMLATQGEAWKRQWFAEGEAKGKAEGKAEGEALGEAKALIRLVEKRFGQLPADRRAHVLAADATSVEAWLDRLMEAPSLEALFGSPN